MQNLIFLCTLSFLLLQNAYSQNDPFYYTEFTKRIENNTLDCGLRDIRPDGTVRPLYNTDSKSDVEKLLFGDFNAPVEFFYGSEYNTPFGFRIISDKSGESWMIEIKTISNFNEANQQAYDKFPSIGFKDPSKVADSVLRHSAAHNTEMYYKQREEQLKLYCIKTESYPVSDSLAKSLHKKVQTLIDHFDTKTQKIPSDFTVTFRCIIRKTKCYF